MAYLKISTMEKVTPEQIMAENPNVSFPAGEWTDEMLAPFGYAILHQPNTHPFPSNKFEILVETDPILIDGKWTIQYQVQSIVPTEPDQLQAFIDQQKQELKTQVTDIRYKFEVAGVTLPDGTVIKTDRESQATLNGALAYLTLNPTETIDWKANGNWVTVNLEQITAIANAVGKHVQEVFTAEKQHYAAINQLTTVDQILNYNINTGWPA